MQAASEDVKAAPSSDPVPAGEPQPPPPAPTNDEDNKGDVKKGAPPVLKQACARCRAIKDPSQLDALAMLAASASIPQLTTTLAPPVSFPPIASTSSQPYPYLPSSAPLSRPTLATASSAPLASQPPNFSPISAHTPNSVKDGPSPRPRLPLLSLTEVAQAKEAVMANLGQSSANQVPPPPQPNPYDAVVREPDPIDMHVLTELEAIQLFDHFHSTLNAFIIMFDKHLHTVEYVRPRSTVLFTSILAASAKFIRKDLYPTLLMSARQLIGRHIVDAKPSIGLIQAILVLVYWKEPTDSSAWLRIGHCIRMGYQLHLHAQRTGPLPPDHHEAREIADRERTWRLLVAFDHTYFLHHEEDDGFHQASSRTFMIPQYRIDIPNWLDELNRHGIGLEDDQEQGANFEWIKVERMSKDIARASPAHARALATHLQGMLDNIYQRYLDPNAPFALNTRSTHKITFFWCAATVALTRALLTAVGTDGVTLAKYMVACSSLVDAFETLARNGYIRYWQDILAVTMYSFGEHFVKIFNKVYPSNQTSILSWMERLYQACESAAEGNAQSTAAYISRFFQLCIRSVCSPSSSAANAAVAAGVAAMPPPPSTSAGPSNAAQILTAPSGANGSATDLLASAASGQANYEALDSTLSLLHPIPGDASYWGSLFPGQTMSDWSWLDQPLDDIMRS
ncbi:hypothetical protein JCM8097_006149 [Rhodosporidiobolus ruineniae]